MRRDLVRRLDESPTIGEIQEELSRFTRRSAIEACAASADEVSPLHLGRLVREIAALESDGSRRMSRVELQRLASQIHQAIDPVALNSIGSYRLHDVVMTR